MKHKKSNSEERLKKERKELQKFKENFVGA